jgi:hypothetical protein
MGDSISSQLGEVTGSKLRPLSAEVESRECSCGVQTSGQRKLEIRYQETSSEDTAEE